VGTELLWDTKTGKVHTQLRDGTSNTVRVFDNTDSVQKNKAEEASKRSQAAPVVMHRYFTLAKGAVKNDPEDGKQSQSKLGGEQDKDKDRGKNQVDKEKQERKPGLDPGIPQLPEAAPAPGRKIIRTGDMEFEVDSFAASVDRINALIDKIEGAFVLD